MMWLSWRDLLRFDNLNSGKTSLWCQIYSLILTCLIIVFVGCSPKSENIEIIDLIADRPPIELQWEEELIDFGTSEARRHLAAGWNRPSPDAPKKFVWSRGDESIFDFDLLAPRNLELTLDCRCLSDQSLPPQQVSVLIGDVEMGRITAGPRWADHSLHLPQDHLNPGRNRLTFRYSWARSPESLGHNVDWRRLAIAIRNVRLGGALQSSPPRFEPMADLLTLPVGSTVQWALSLRPGARLEIGRIEAEIGDGEVVISVSDDGGEEYEFARWTSGKNLGVDLPSQIEGQTRLIFRHFPGESPSGAFVLRSVQILNPRPTQTEADSNRSIPSSLLNPPNARRFNVVVYLVDALRVDHLGVYGYGRATSHRIDLFAEQSLVFDNAWANSSWTRPAVASILTGLRPEVHRTNRREDRLPAAVTTLPEILLTQGYQTAAIIANPNVSALFGFDQGFDVFNLLPPEERRSTDIHEAATLWMSRDREATSPFFLYLHTVDPHLPYDPPTEQRQAFAAGVERRGQGSSASVGALRARHLADEASYVDDLIDLYDGEIAANDRQFGKFLDEIEDLGLAEQTIVIFLADHGEQFFDHGGWIHGDSLYSELLRIPLIIRVPDSQNAGRTAMPVQQADLMPTILGLLGMSVPTNLQGRNLLEEEPPGLRLGAFLDLDGKFGRSVIGDGWHAIQHGKNGYLGPPEIYRLDSDPAEKNDLGLSLQARPATMLGDDRVLIQGDENRYQASDAEIDEETRKQLEALGYL